MSGDWTVGSDGDRAWLAADGRRFACAIGRGGIRTDKREGDGATPVGRFPLRRLLYRPDRLPRPATGLPVVAIGRDDGWCDDPGHADYNCPIRLPHPARHERLWRDDPLYDLVVVIGHNDMPVVAGAGSAVFVHVARDGYAPTEGCVALTAADLLHLLARATTDTRLVVEAP
ncbi:L,D-transpeptidase [Stella sp.]|uniref:L,D-transpeptidase family protein n=1 Tax=Stella sp. TaxID=2912054 RepID=UPI0035AF3FA7